jgi:4-hydroxy-tetrahydrodipicolinate synthase
MAKTISVITSSITPFDDKGRLDEKSFRQHLGRLRSAGISVYVGGAGTGETYALSPEERERIIQIAVEELKGKVPIRAMAFEPRVPQEILDFLRRAEPLKPDAVVVFSLDIGHGAKPTPAEMEAYYSTVIGSTSLPIVLSSHQSVGYFLPLELIERLVNRFPNVAGISYGGSNIPYLANLLKRVGDRVEVHCAGPTNGLTVLGLGGNGFMGYEGSFCPELVASVISAYRANDMARVSQMFGKLMVFNGIIERFGGSSMRAMKPLLNAFGLPGGTLRPPRLPVSREDLKEIVREVLALELPGLPPLADKELLS